MNKQTWLTYSDGSNERNPVTPADMQAEEEEEQNKVVYRAGAACWFNCGALAMVPQSDAQDDEL